MNTKAFYENLKQDKTKLYLFNEGINSHQIQNFDSTLIHRLKKLYYSFMTGLIYIYYEPTSFENIVNKLEFLTHASEDKDFVIVNGTTNSTRNIKFFLYNIKHLDYNVWLEVKEGNKTWVYDLFSMFKIEKDLYYKLENPNILKKIEKMVVINHPARLENNYYRRNYGDEILFKDIFISMKDNLDNHPFKYILEPEISRWLNVINDEKVKKKS